MDCIWLQTLPFNCDTSCVEAKTSASATSPCRRNLNVCTQVQLPEGLCVIGDAVAAFNPVYGQARFPQYAGTRLM